MDNRSDDAIIMQVTDALQMWFDYLNVSDKNLKKKSQDAYYEAIKAFCDKKGITNVAFIVVNRFKGTIDIIQHATDASLVDEKKEKALENMPFVKYPDWKVLEGQGEDEDAKKIKIIDRFFERERNNSLLTRTELFKDLYEKNQPNYKNYKLCKVDKQIISQWKKLVGIPKSEKIKDFFSNNFISDAEGRMTESTCNDVFDDRDFKKEDKIELHFDEEKRRKLLYLHMSSDFPIIPYTYLLDEEEEEDKNAILYHLIIPISSSSHYHYSVSGNELSIGTLLVATLKRNKEFSKEEEESFIKKTRTLFSLAVVPLLDGYFYKYIVHQELNRSAISAVMARNLSHNYGSHVLNNLLKPKRETFEVMNGPFLQTIGLKLNENSEMNLSDSNNGEGTSDEEIWLQLTHFINHIKCRMDYCSDISFGAPLIQTKRDVMEIFTEYDRVRLLLNHISGLEESFKFKIKILHNDKLLYEKPLSIAVPNSVVGTSAIYNIIENIIRNTAKHAVEKPKNEVIFTIRFSDIKIDKTLPKVLITEAKQLYCVEIYDNVPMKKEDVESLVKMQNESLNLDVVEANGRPRSTSLGIVEMEASAAYLRKLDSFTIDEEEYRVWNDEKYYNQYNQFNLLKAIKIKHSEKEDIWNFGYRFFVLRPQEVLIVSNNIEGIIVINDEEKKRIKDFLDPTKGIWVISTNDFMNELKKGKVFNHEIVAYMDNESKKVVVDPKYKTAISPRIIELNANELKTKDSDSIIEHCWELWKTTNQNNWKFIHISFTSTSENASKIAVYNHHLKKDNPDAIKNVKYVYKYVEVLSTLAIDKLPKREEIKDSDKAKGYVQEQLLIDALIMNKNLESVNNKVLVVDERIQEASVKNSYSTILFSVYYEKMGVTVPKQSEINLMEKDFSQIAKKLQEYIEEEAKINDFVLVHYGLLERIFKTSNPNNENWKKEMDVFLDGLAKHTRVVITSGRGVPYNLPESVSFVGLSSVISALIEYRSKYMLNCLLYSSRKSNQKENIN